MLLIYPFRSGVYNVPIDWLTDDGYDMTFGVNIVGMAYMMSVNRVVRAYLAHRQGTSSSPSCSCLLSKRARKRLQTIILASYGCRPSPRICLPFAGIL